MIKDSCKCGATFEVSSGTEDWQSYRYTEFLEAHRVCRERPPEKPIEAILGHPEPKTNKDMGNGEEGFKTAYIEPEEPFCEFGGWSRFPDCRKCSGTEEDYLNCKWNESI